MIGARATRLVIALAIAAALLAAVGYAGAAAQQGGEDEHTVTIGGLAKQVEREPDDSSAGTGGAEPRPEPTPAPTAAPDPAPTAIPTAAAGTFPAHIEQWRPLAASIFPASVVDEALFIIKCESNGNPDATGSQGERGLMQIHPLYHQARADEMFGTGANLYDPHINLSVASAISNGGANWSPWSWCAGQMP